MAKASASKKSGGGRSGSRGGFAIGLVAGLLLGLALALGVALYITKAPVPFIDKVPQRSADQDSAEAEKNKAWDPNAPLVQGAQARPAARSRWNLRRGSRRSSGGA